MDTQSTHPAVHQYVDHLRPISQSVESATASHHSTTQPGGQFDYVSTRASFVSEPYHSHVLRPVRVVPLHLGHGVEDMAPPPSAGSRFRSDATLHLLRATDRHGLALRLSLTGKNFKDAHASRPVIKVFWQKTVQKRSI
eukprot:scaffold527262_cov32-Prasinocladus_malaysianus.AAC.1